MSPDISHIRSQFPILEQTVNGTSLVYLDNAATTHNPQAVIDASARYYTELNSNIHRGAHFLSREATAAHEAARDTIAQHINAASSHEVIFTAGTTDSINLVSNTLALSGKITTGDRILISGLEHHSNIVPWQMVAAETGAEVVPVDVNDQGDVDLQALENLLDDRVKLVSCAHICSEGNYRHLLTKRLFLRPLLRAISVTL